MMERFSYKLTEFQRMTLVNSNTGLPWVVPESGLLKVDFTLELLPPNFNQVPVFPRVKAPRRGGARLSV